MKLREKLQQPVNGAVLGVAGILTGASMLVLAKLVCSSGEPDSVRANQLADLQLLLYIAFAALLPPNRDLRKSTENPAGRAALMLMTITCVSAPAIVFVFGAGSSVEPFLGGLGILTVLSIGLVINDAVHGSAPESPSAEEIAKQVVGQMPAPPAATDPDTIADAVVEKLDSDTSRTMRIWRLAIRWK